MIWHKHQTTRQLGRKKYANGYIESNAYCLLQRRLQPSTSNNCSDPSRIYLFQKVTSGANSAATGSMLRVCVCAVQHTRIAGQSLQPVMHACKCPCVYMQTWAGAAAVVTATSPEGQDLVFQVYPAPPACHIPISLSHPCSRLLSMASGLQAASRDRPARRADAQR